MARARDPNRDQAKQIWLDHGGNITNRQIAEHLSVDEKRSPSGSSVTNGMLYNKRLILLYNKSAVHPKVTRTPSAIAAVLLLAVKMP